MRDKIVSHIKKVKVRGSIIWQWGKTLLKNFQRKHYFLLYRKQLHEVAQDLSSLACESEQEFLDLGKQLQEFSSATNQIFKQTKLSLQKLDGTKKENVLQKIRLLLEDVSTILEKQSENIESSYKSLKPLASKLFQLSSLQNDFQKISRSLSILGTSIKIESSRAGHLGQDFMVLGLDMERAWSEIKKDLEQFFSSTTKLANELNFAQDNVTCDYNRYWDLVSGIRDSIISAVKEVEEVFCLSSQAIERIADCVHHISREVGKIVCSLQTHDIIRQQLEHIHQSVNEMERQLKEGSNLHPQKISKSLHEMNQTLLIQMSQLKNTIYEMDQSGSGIRNGLAQVAEKLKKENDAFLFMDKNSAGHKVAEINILEDKINQLTTILHQSEDLGEKIFRAVRTDLLP